MKPVKLGITIILLAGALVFIIKNRFLPDNNDSLQQLIKHYETKGIHIDLNTPTTHFPTWKGAQALIQPISTQEAVRVLKILLDEVHVYPNAVLKKNLESLYLYSDLTLYGAKYGGTQLGKKIFIVSRGVRLGYSDQFIKSTFHHEMSSVLMRYNTFSEQQWRSQLPSGVSYVQDSSSWPEEKK